MDSAIKDTLLDRPNLVERISKSLEIVEKNDMHGLLTIECGLDDAKLIEEIKKHRIRFALPYSAAYHAAKHWAHNPGAYVNEANGHIGPKESIGLKHPTQEGDAFDISFRSSGSNLVAYVLERDGKVLLKSFYPDKAKK